MNVFKALAIGAILGFLVAEVSACSSSSCGPNNCSGCCDANTKKCITIANQSVTDCGGSVGNVCGVCTGSETCASGACTSNANDAGMGCADCPGGCCGTNQLGAKVCLYGSSLNNASCGTGGAACQACQSGTHCQLAADAINGTCLANAPDGGPSGGVGLPCTTAADCAPFLGTAGVCLTTTPDGGGTYVDGYCTVLACNTQTNAGCPGNSSCFNFADLGFDMMPFPGGAYGENRTFCLMGCTSDYDCVFGRPDQIPDYACWFGDQFDTQTGQFSSTALGCFINQAPTTAKAGGPCDWGSTITNAQYSECALPPTNGQCVPQTLADGGPTGWTNGYCFSSCLASVLFTNADTYCGTGAMCIVDSTSTYNAYGLSGLPASADCYSSCPAPNGGQSTCRTGYVCFALTEPDGGTAPNGICQPACDVAGGACNPGFTCVDAGTTAGYCCTNAGGDCSSDQFCCSNSCNTGTGLCDAADAGDGG
jgi:hypothetical protein